MCFKPYKTTNLDKRQFFYWSLRGLKLLKASALNCLWNNCSIFLSSSSHVQRNPHRRQSNDEFDRRKSRDRRVVDTERSEERKLPHRLQRRQKGSEEWRDCRFHRHLESFCCQQIIMLFHNAHLFHFHWFAYFDRGFDLSRAFFIDFFRSEC